MIATKVKASRKQVMLIRHVDTTFVTIVVFLLFNRFRFELFLALSIYSFYISREFSLLYN